MKYLRIISVISLLLALVVFFSRCFNGDSLTHSDPRGDQYAGAATCTGCHRQLSGACAHSAHFNASSPVDAARLAKQAAAWKGRFYFADSSYISLEENKGTFSQANFVNDQREGSGSFDLAIGSGEKAQTYGYWKDSTLYQLPLTYFTVMHTWANSPGFPSGHARFGRVITSRCLECHGSYVKATFVQTGSLTVSEQLDRNSIVYGIDCERCHGPAMQHVRYQQENPTLRTAKYIASIRSLSRQRQLDLCALCHSGNDQSTQRSLFSFTPGDTLSHFYYPGFGAPAGEPDVHGKQLQLLQASRCFQRTQMTCTTCHNAHGEAASQPSQPSNPSNPPPAPHPSPASPPAQDPDRMALFVAKCMDCHGNSAHAAARLKDNSPEKGDHPSAAAACINCHMPLQMSKAIYFNNGAELKNIPYFLRTHKIAIYK